MSALRSKRGASPVSRKRRCSGGARRGFHPLGLLALGLGTAVLVFGSAWHSAPLRAWPVRPDAGRAARGTASGPPLYSAAGEPADSIQFENPLSGVIKPGETRVLKTASLVASGFYSVEVSLDSPSKLTPPNALVPAKIASPITFNVVKEEIYPPQARVEMKFDSPGNPAIAKGLHAGDPGSYFIVRAAGPGAATLTLTAPDSAGGEPMGFRVALRPLRVGSGDDSEIVPNTARDWKHAAPMTLGKTVFGSADDIEYFYNTDEGKNGWQWLTFEYKESKPRLVFFELDLLDRDVPCTMKIYREEAGAEGPHLAEYTEGKDPTEIRHDDQYDELVNFKFLTRVLAPGRYYLSVKANHPVWSLRTTLFDPPPYSDPQKAVEVAMRYMVDVGDSFFSNTPRKGSVRTRAENVTDETERCITCHPAHFTMLSTLTAVRNGYTVANPPEFKFMMDKLYNAPGPFYGFPDTYWLRFELAPANGISRLGTMLLMYEDLVSHRATETPARTGNYLRLVYDARDLLPRADTVHYVEKFQPTKTRNYEFDGNRPISDFRVATDSWFVLDHLSSREPSFAPSAAHLESLINSTTTNDLEDIVEQTKGLVAMMAQDPSLKAKFQPLVEKNVQAILARQHDDGGWVTAEYMSNEQFFDAAARAPFEKPTDPSLQFVTGEVLYTLKIAGYDMNDPRLQKAERWLLGLQRDFGGWLDNKGELFLQPHLETKWAVMGLSQNNPESGPAVPPAPAPPAFLNADLSPEEIRDLPLAPTLDWLDQLWYDRQASHLGLVLPLLSSPEPLVREAAAAAIGRMAVDAPDAAPFEVAVKPLVGALGDRVKMVSRAAAWSLRQLGNDGLGIDEVKAALASDDDYTRRGAARVFYQYAYHMSGREDVARALIRGVDDPDMLVRIESLKALWRWWYRTPDFTLRREIEQAFLERAGVEREHPLVRLNVAQALHNILDENTVQFHKNWLRSMALQADRDRAEQARIEEVERPLAKELAAALTPENATARLTLLTALDYYFLRGGIGNDYDPIMFYDRQAAETVARALLPLVDSPDAQLAGKALKALAVVREARDRDVLMAVMRKLASPDKSTREIAEQELSRFPTEYVSQTRPARTPAGGGR